MGAAVAVAAVEEAAEAAARKWSPTVPMNLRLPLLVAAPVAADQCWSHSWRVVAAAEVAVAAVVSEGPRKARCLNRAPIWFG